MKKLLPYICMASFVCMVFIGCGTITISCCEKILSYGRDEADPRSIKGVESRLQPYAKSFEEAFNVSIGDVPVNTRLNEYEGIEERNNLAVGTCLSWETEDKEYEYKEVIVNPKYMEEFKDNGTYYLEIEQLVWHELGHCVLNREHRNDSRTVEGTVCYTPDKSMACSENGEMPLSIMRWHVFTPVELELYYKPFKPWYIEEMKEKK